MTARDAATAARARRYGAHYTVRIVREARRAGVPVSLAFALIQQESNFRNVFGHDPTIFRGAGTVTRRKYLAYRRQRGPTGKGGMQGVGPAQLTWWQTQDAADQLGGCWKPGPNIRQAFKVLAGHIKAHGPHNGIARYNGTGPRADQYATSVQARAQHWHRLLTPSR